MFPPPNGWGWQMRAAKREWGAPSFTTASRRPAGPVRLTLRRAAVARLVLGWVGADAAVIPHSILRDGGITFPLGPIRSQLGYPASMCGIRPQATRYKSVQSDIF